MLEVPCPFCKQVLKMPPEMAGRAARCPKCQAAFTAPGEAIPAVESVQSFDFVKMDREFSIRQGPPKKFGWVVWVVGIVFAIPGFIAGLLGSEVLFFYLYPSHRDFGSSPDDYFAAHHSLTLMGASVTALAFAAIPKLIVMFVRACRDSDKVPASPRGRA